ncbi:unnamed protein product [Didymodactylos carnosus]|uniref:Uncharacterized protein n=1 Tax=Didymodactylos carnosus TaxID=1234261 RepID=A0A814YX48_9BILA|nr:unnamed protein product [Didymodactylos carnosus]CAF1236989.1 unnamed protein product [Didymodactylos carnosus]CAF3833030.1 unnamed protein product [Didymodactylos carnosus]CAF3999345.1 unnamed protein product [Didymodactylos carnosus]
MSRPRILRVPRKIGDRAAFALRITSRSRLRSHRVRDSKQIASCSRFKSDCIAFAFWDATHSRSKSRQTKLHRVRGSDQIVSRSWLGSRRVRDSDKIKA